MTGGGTGDGGSEGGCWGAWASDTMICFYISTRVDRISVRPWGYFEWNCGGVRGG